MIFYFKCFFKHHEAIVLPVIDDKQLNSEFSCEAINKHGHLKKTFHIAQSGNSINRKDAVLPKTLVIPKVFSRASPMEILKGESIESDVIKRGF